LKSDGNQARGAEDQRLWRWGMGRETLPNQLGILGERHELV